MQTLSNATSINVEQIDNPASVDYITILKAARVIRLLNHKLRKQIINIIFENKKLTVTQLYLKMGLEQSVTSHHLAILRRSGIVSTEREGKYIYYMISLPRLVSISRFSKDIIN